MSTNEENELLCQLAGKELALADANKLADEALAQVATLEQENARLREEKPHHVVDWPDSEGNWWNNRASYPCRVTRSGCGEMLIGSEQNDKWVGRKEWESLIGKTQWAKMSEENPLPLAW